MLTRRKQTPIDKIFYALGDPTRRALLTAISSGPIAMSHLAKPLDISLAAVAQHVEVLEDSGLVRTEKVGRVRLCRVEPSGLRSAERWIADQRAVWERRLDRLGMFLDEEK